MSETGMNATGLARPLDAQVPSGSGLWDFLMSNTFTVVVPGAVTFAILLSHWFTSKHDNYGYPYIGYKSWWEPTFWLRLRFVLGAVDILRDGYYKVQITARDEMMRSC
jgi:hypothetical protein